MREDDPLTYEIIGAAIEVSKILGVGLLESVYETCLAEELKNRGLRILRQVGFPVFYKGVKVDLAFRADLVVESAVVVEVKALEAVHKVHHAQLLTYMRLSQTRKGLLINFYADPFAKGIKRMIL